MKSITTEQLKQLQKKGQKLILVNTLDAEYFGETRVPQAINIPLSSPDFTEEVLLTAGDKNQPIVVYCASNECDSSTRAAERLEEAGFTQVYDYEGGARAWREHNQRQSMHA